MMIAISLTKKEADVLFDLMMIAVAKNGRKIVELVADAESMTPKDVRQLLADVGVRIRDREKERVANGETNNKD